MTIAAPTTTGFVVSQPDQDHVLAVEHQRWPFQFHFVTNASVNIKVNQEAWGVVYQGTAQISSSTGHFYIEKDMVFQVSGEAQLKIKGQVAYILKPKKRDFFQLAGPIAEQGYLRYIDGCTDTLLIAPLIKGEPCLNHLHFPMNINQTMHTHPSYRLGLVLRGSGVCHLQANSYPLQAGSIFHIPADLEHAFQTHSSYMDIVAFHPDSDFGPEHDDHPMINRTIVEGVSAKFIENIRT